jgi:hypothetical protein
LKGGRLGGAMPFVGWGTAGRDVDTPLNYYTLGDGSPTDTGITTVHVQLFDGRDPTVPLEAATGQGRYVMCQLAQGIVTLPPFGARVLVVSPSSHGTAPGNSVIVYVVDPSAPALQPGETCFIPTIGGTRGIARKDGTVELGAILPQFHAAVSELVDQAVTTIVEAFNTHTHVVAGACPPGGGALTGGTAAPPTPGITPAPGSTASKILKLSG